VSVEEELTSLAVVERRTSETVTEQRAGMTLKNSQSGLEVISADVDANSLLGISAIRTITKWSVSLLLAQNINTAQTRQKLCKRRQTCVETQVF